MTEPLVHVFEMPSLEDLLSKYAADDAEVIEGPGGIKMVPNEAIPPGMLILMPIPRDRETFDETFSRAVVMKNLTPSPPPGIIVEPLP